MATSYLRGHLIEFDEEKNCWLYVDTGKSILIDRECARCGKMPTEKGHDACIANTEGAYAACCGHGKTDGYIAKKSEYIILKNRRHKMNKIEKSDREYTQMFAIRSILIRNCGSNLSPDMVDKLSCEIEEEITNSPCSWAFKESNTEFISIEKKLPEVQEEPNMYNAKLYEVIVYTRTDKLPLRTLGYLYQSYFDKHPKWILQRWNDFDPVYWRELPSLPPPPEELEFEIIRNGTGEDKP
jgi:hypothetical protein